MEEKDAGQAEHLTLNQENVRCYVGVGASAGGVEALQELFQHMPCLLYTSDAADE